MRIFYKQCIMLESVYFEMFSLFLCFPGNPRFFIAARNVDKKEDKECCSIGEIFCKRSDGIFFLDGSSRLEEMNPEEDRRFQEIPFTLLRVLSAHHYEDAVKAIEAVLSGQLEGIHLLKGEQVLVATSGEKTGNPKNDLSTTTIEGVEARQIITQVLPLVGCGSICFLKKRSINFFTGNQIQKDSEDSNMASLSSL